jgi:hypothetical protein
MISLLVKLGVVLVIVSVVSGCAGGRVAQWKFLGSTDLYEGYYYVVKSHLLYKGTVQVSVKLEYTEKGAAEYAKEFGRYYENLSYSLQLWEINCPTREHRMLSLNEYSAEGNRISTKLGKRRFSESLGKSLIEAVCN